MSEWPGEYPTAALVDEEVGPLPLIGTAAGPQVVVLRLSRGDVERVFRTPSFEAASHAWRHGARLLQPGGYCVWLNDGTIWRRSGLLDDPWTAEAVRARVL